MSKNITFVRCQDDSSSWWRYLVYILGSSFLTIRELSSPNLDSIIKLFFISFHPHI